MMIEYRKADIADAELLISIYNSAFYSDYIKYGECPAYGKTKEMMEKSILEAELFRIMEKSLKAAMDKALDDIFKDWK